MNEINMNMNVANIDIIQKLGAGLLEEDDNNI